MMRTIPQCWPCRHFQNAQGRHICTRKRPEFPATCAEYEYEPGNDRQVAEQELCK